MDLPDGHLIHKPETAYCVVSASHRYNVPVESLLGIMLVEGGKVGQQVRNTNGTFDLGPMQVNTVWLTQQSPLYGYVTQANLRDNLCINIHSAAWILASQLAKAKDIWKAVGRYHSPGNETFAWNYKQKVNSKLPQARAVIQNTPYYGNYMLAFFGATQKAEE